jgi:hypothetical protein
VKAVTYFLQTYGDHDSLYAISAINEPIPLEVNEFEFYNQYFTAAWNAVKQASDDIKFVINPPGPISETWMADVAEEDVVRIIYDYHYYTDFWTWNPYSVQTKVSSIDDFCTGDSEHAGYNTAF